VIADQIRQHGSRIESHTDYQAVLIEGSKPSHILHLILTLVTAGLWAFIWLVIALFGGDPRRLLETDEYGYMTFRHEY
jgi:hypothetical protein